MRARKFLLLAVVAVAAIVAARALGLWAGSQFLSPQPDTTPLPALVFAAADLTFGPIPESESVARELRLTNTSTEPVTIERFEKSCSCLGIEPAGNFTVAPGETTVLRVKLNSSIPPAAKLSDDGLFYETVNLDAVAMSSPGVRPQRFSAVVRFTVRQTVRFDPPTVPLGVVSHREPVTVKTTLTLREPIQDIRILPHPDWTVIVTPKGDCVREITATPTKPGAVRMVNDTLRVIPVGSDGDDRPERWLTIKGEIKPDIVSSPADISLGRVLVVSEAVECFRLESLTGRCFTVLDAKADPPEVVVSSDRGESASFVVKVRLVGQGDRERNVRVRVKQDDGQELMVIVPVRYLGHTEK